MDSVKECVVELKRAAVEVESSFGREGDGVVGGELRELISTLEEGLSRSLGGT